MAAAVGGEAGSSLAELTLQADAAPNASKSAGRFGYGAAAAVVDS